MIIVTSDLSILRQYGTFIDLSAFLLVLILGFILVP